MCLKNQKKENHKFEHLKMKNKKIHILIIVDMRMLKTQIYREYIWFISSESMRAETKND